jgi:hypothetical protein
LREALEDQTSKTQTSSGERSSDILDTVLDVSIVLLRDIAKKTPVLLVLQFEYGTSLFPERLEDQDIFWKVVTKLSALVQTDGVLCQPPSSKPLVMMILCREADKQNVAVKVAKQTDSHMPLKGLTEENILEYMSSYLAVPAEMVPQKLRMFVAKVTLGNPLHIRETIEQLRQNHIQIDWGANKQPRRLKCQDIEMSHV